MYRAEIDPTTLPISLPAFMLVSCSAYSSTLKIEAICSSEASVDIQRITWRYIPQDSTLQKKKYVEVTQCARCQMHNLRSFNLNREFIGCKAKRVKWRR
jgi:hypothetical protein